MDQLERIAYMEQLLEEGVAGLELLAQALEGCCNLRDKLKELEQYYHGPLWRTDFEDDCAGKLPAGLKRGVLSEDAVYDLLCEHDNLMAQLRELLDENKETIKNAEKP